MSHNTVPMRYVPPVKCASAIYYSVCYLASPSDNKSAARGLFLSRFVKVCMDPRGCKQMVALFFNYQNTCVGNTKRTFSSNIRRTYRSKEKHLHICGSERSKLPVILLTCLFL